MGSTTYNGSTLTSGEVVWDLTGVTLPGQKASGQDNTADIAISVPGDTIIGATLRQVPLVKPSYADIVAANTTTTFTPECQAYYDAKAAVPLAITIPGPSMTGTQALYGVQNNSGDVALAGGSATWGVGSTYWSNAIGNYIHDGNAATSPSVSGLSYSRDGIF